MVDELLKVNAGGGVTVAITGTLADEHNNCPFIVNLGRLDEVVFTEVSFNISVGVKLSLCL